MSGRTRNIERYQALSFHNPYVLIYRRIADPINRATWPFHFKVIYLVGSPYPQNLAWVVRSQIAAASVFTAASLPSVSNPGNDCSYRSGITLGGDQSQSNPIVPVI